MTFLQGMSPPLVIPHSPVNIGTNTQLTTTPVLFTISPFLNNLPRLDINSLTALIQNHLRNTSPVFQHPIRGVHNDIDLFLGDVSLNYADADWPEGEGFDVVGCLGLSVTAKRFPVTVDFVLLFLIVD